MILEELMGGVLLLCGFLFCGLISADALFRRRCALVRTWLGLCGGLLMMMWLPALYAFVLGFTATAQWLALATAAMIAAACSFAMRGKPRPSTPFCGGMPRWLPLVLVLPLTLLSGYLQYTHILRDVSGALHVGQSTYGDLCLHLGIATSLRNAAFPPDYSILKGALLGYPFLSDSMVTSMLLFGTDLSQAFVLTGTLMMVLVYAGYVILAWELTKKPMAVVLTFVLMFINGGLGFLYTFDGVMRDSTALREVFTGFYKTPTNQPDLNLRWVNVICDMMIPQRTLLGGWTLLIPALYLLVTAMRENRTGSFAILGVWAGSMPMVHTHSFMALGLLSAGAMLCKAVWPGRESRKALMLNFVCYGAIAVALALPQLLTWTFPQTIDGGSLRFRFNWVNNQGNGTLIDGYFWFWIKNVGLIYLLILPAVLSCRKGSACRTLAVGALFIYIVAEFIQFQPNEYDNNKLFYVAFMAILPAIGLYLTKLWNALKGVRGRAFLAAVFLLISTISGALSIGREVVSDYQLFGATEVEAAQFIEENTDPDAVFLTGQQHNNAVAALTGRYILCGTGSYLYFHGIDYSAQQLAARLLLENPSENEALFEEYGIDYVYISSHERSDFAVDSGYFAANGKLVFENFDVQIYAISDRALARES